MSARARTPVSHDNNVLLRYPAVTVRALLITAPETGVWGAPSQAPFPCGELRGKQRALDPCLDRQSTFPASPLRAFGIESLSSQEYSRVHPLVRSIVL